MLRKVLFSLFIIFQFTFLLCAEEKLYVYAWSASIPRSVINKFEKETGIKVFFSTYDSNETMFSKLKLIGKKASYDIVMPSTYFIDRMLRNDLLIKLDLNKIPNAVNIEEEAYNFLSDNDKEYVMPYTAYFTGMLYNEKYVDNGVDTWSTLFDSKYKNRILILDDIREMFSIPLILLGYSVDSINKQELEKAYKKLKILFSHARLISSELVKDSFVNEEVVLGVAWNSDAGRAMKENDHLRFSFPKERALLSIDNFAILKTSKNIKNAHKFINFLLRPEISLQCVDELFITIPNIKMKKLFVDKYDENKVLFPNMDVWKNAVINKDVGNSIKIYDKYWGMLKVEN